MLNSARDRHLLEEAFVRRRKAWAVWLGHRQVWRARASGPEKKFTGLGVKDCYWTAIDGL